MNENRTREDSNEFKHPTELVREIVESIKSSTDYDTELLAILEENILCQEPPQEAVNNAMHAITRLATRRVNGGEDDK